MTSKQAIVSELGDREILAPDLIARSLVANDQAKYYFALLLNARGNADRPRVPALDLKTERLASRIPDAWLDDVVAGARKIGGDLYSVPRAGEILGRIRGAIVEMLECLPDAERASLSERLAAFPDIAPPDDAIPGSLIAAMTSADRDGGDSLHLLVMDAHRAINRLQAETAVETVAGARVHRLSALGRKRVEAFMSGLNRTAPLKFDHPGLGTTATELDGRLLIQNDIGTTDAHVLVVRVDGLSATVSYTDIHRARLKFFKSLFHGFDMAWEGTEEHRSARFEEGHYSLATGTFTAPDEAALERFLAHLGSRIVFLIDWNRMRKRLLGFVGKDEAVGILRWAAEKEYGHRALLEVGGEDALAAAVEYAAGAELRYGQRLDDLISPDRAVAFIREAMEIASDGLRQRRSRRNIRDEIKARLRRYFENERLGIFDMAARHTAIGYDLAFALVEASSRIGGNGEWIGRLAARAVTMESDADQILNEARDDIKRFARPQALLAFFERADDAVDELEEAVALTDLAGLVEPSAAAVARVKELADLPLRSAQELVKCVECAAAVTRSDVRDDLDEFMTALETLIVIEHKADDVLRDLRRWLIQENLDQRQVMVLRDLSEALESATDAHLHAGQALRTYLMEEVIA
jgi:uncharacterized protein Yka (UPF0111/DUF47 family)